VGGHCGAFVARRHQGLIPALCIAHQVCSEYSAGGVSVATLPPPAVLTTKPETEFQDKGCFTMSDKSKIEWTDATWNPEAVHA